MKHNIFLLLLYGFWTNSVIVILKGPTVIFLNIFLSFSASYILFLFYVSDYSTENYYLLAPRLRPMRKNIHMFSIKVTFITHFLLYELIFISIFVYYFVKKNNIGLIWFSSFVYCWHYRWSDLRLYKFKF